MDPLLCLLKPISNIRPPNILIVKVLVPHSLPVNPILEIPNPAIPLLSNPTLPTNPIEALDPLLPLILRLIKDPHHQLTKLLPHLLNIKAVKKNLK